MSVAHEAVSSALPRDLDALPRLNGFRLRGMEMTRLEGFVDATFAFAVTMLIIAGQQVPDDAAAVLSAFRSVPAFAASIGVLSIFWRGHWLWSRRYGLEDGVSILISWLLIFTMLIYVYPLKLVFNGMFYLLSGGRAGMQINLPTLAEGRWLFAMYALGFITLALSIVLLNVRAWRLREPLRLNEREQRMTRGEIVGWCVPVAVGTISLLLALFAPRDLLSYSGWVYFSLAVLVPLHRRLQRRKLARMASA